jgi:hypothetical protein
MLTKRRGIVVLCVLVVLLGCAWVYDFFTAPFEAEAELMVQPRSALEVMMDGPLSSRSADDQLVIAQSMSQLIRSRAVVSHALSRDSVKNHPIVKAQADPEAFVIDRLQVEVTPPGVIVVRMKVGQDPALCAAIVNAVVDAFVDREVAAERLGKRAEIQGIEARLAERIELEKKKRADLENLRQVLGSPDSGRWSQVELLKAEAEQLKQLSSQLRHKLLQMEMGSIEGDEAEKDWSIATVSRSNTNTGVGGDSDGGSMRFDWPGADWTIALSFKKAGRTTTREVVQERARRYKEECDRCTTLLSKTLEQLGVAQNGLQNQATRSFELETRQHEVDLLGEQVDDLCRFKNRLELLLEAESRVEVISQATKPVSRQYWFRWGHDT